MTAELEILFDEIGRESARQLPVFQVLGGSSKGRQQYIQGLITVLNERSLSSVFLPASDAVAHKSSGILTLSRCHDVLFLDSGEEKAEKPVQLLSPVGASLDTMGQTTGWKLKSDADRLVKELDELAAQTPVWACILIGGKSSRMGRPKHLLTDTNNKTWLERSVDILSPLVDGLVVSGAGYIPEDLAALQRLDDIPGVVGPLTGIVAATRWRPMASWLFVACDMPNISPEAVRWLLSSRHSGCWGRVPKQADSDYCEPLFAWYDFRAGVLFERQVADENLRIGSVAGHPKIANPVIPDALSAGWQNINTPEQLAGLKG